MKEREPKGPVQRIAAGLLGFFQLKDQGNPTVIGDMLQGVLELKDWYLETASEIPVVSTRSLATLSSGFFGFNAGGGAIVVPQDEWWYVENFTVYAGLPAATETLSLAPALRYTTASQDFILGAPSRAVTGGNQAVAALAEKFWAPPGSELGAFIVQAASATTLTLVGAIRFTRLPI